MHPQCYLLPVEQLLTHGSEEVSLQRLGQDVEHQLSRLVLDAHVSAIDAVLQKEVAYMDMPGAVRC